MKDLDFLKTHTQIKVGPKFTSRLIEQMEIDSKFLEANGIIDYSFLIGVHEKKAAATTTTSPQDKRKSFLSFVFGDPQQNEAQEKLLQEAEYLKKMPMVGGSFFQSDDGGMYSDRSDLTLFSFHFFLLFLIKCLLACIFLCAD